MIDSVFIGFHLVGYEANAVRAMTVQLQRHALRQGDLRPVPLHDGTGMVGGRFANECGKKRCDRSPRAHFGYTARRIAPMPDSHPGDP